MRMLIPWPHSHSRIPFCNYLRWAHLYAKFADHWQALQFPWRPRNPNPPFQHSGELQRLRVQRDRFTLGTSEVTLENPIGTLFAEKN